MDKILLIRPAYSSSIYKVYGKLPSDREIRPPLGLMYIAAYLEQHQYPVTILDAEVTCKDHRKIIADILRIKPAWIGITCTTPEFPSLIKLCKMIKTACPTIKIVVGGPHFSAISDFQGEEFVNMDYIVKGEGEKAFLEILQKRPTVKMVFHVNKDPLDHLPFPARHLVNYAHYRFPRPGHGMVKMDTVLTSRGCPFQCSFCFNRTSPLRYREITKVVDEIQLSLEEYGTKFIMFLDDTLTLSKKRVFELCDEIMKRRLHEKLVFYANARADTVDSEMLERMKEAGIVEMSMGVESGNQAMLDRMHKGTRLEQYAQVYHWMKKLGIETRGSFIVGFPYETHQTIRDTINFAKKVDLVRVSCCILTPYPGTEVYDMAQKGEGLYLLSKNWEDFTRYGKSVIRTDELTQKDLESYQKLFFMEFYTQPKVLFYHLFQVLKGNFSIYYYRPVFFALKMRIKSLLENPGIFTKSSRKTKT